LIFQKKNFGVSGNERGGALDPGGRWVQGGAEFL